MRRRARGFGLSFLLVAWTVGAAEPSTDACAGLGTAVVALTGAHRLVLCEAGASVRSFSLRVGSEGTGKRRTGDKKTPLGTYGLGAPRPSKKFGTFVPIGYPTAAQRAKGFTGGDVGIHGPHRWSEWAGEANNWVDTSDGCLGIANDEQMGELSGWLRQRRPNWIHIR